MASQKHKHVIPMALTKQTPYLARELALWRKKRKMSDPNDSGVGMQSQNQGMQSQDQGEMTAMTQMTATTAITSTVTTTATTTTESTSTTLGTQANTCLRRATFPGGQSRQNLKHFSRTVCQFACTTTQFSFNSWIQRHRKQRREACLIEVHV